MALQNYVDLATMKTYLNMTSTNLFDGLLESSISAASRVVDRYCNRYFGREDELSTRTFDVHGCNVVWIDDVWSDAGFVSTVDGTLFPYNNTLNGESGWPFDRLRTSSAVRGTTVDITALWGWEETPDAIVETTKMTAAEMFMQKDTPLGVKSFDDMGALYLRERKHISKKLDLYTKHRVMVF